MKPNCYEMQTTCTESLKNLLNYLNRRYVPCGTSCRKKLFPKSSDQKTLDMSKVIGLWRYQCQEKLHIAYSEVTCTKIQIAAVREGVNSNCSGAFCLEKRDLKSGECCELCSYCWRDKQTHPDSDLTDEGWFVSNDRQQRDTRQARDVSRCSTDGVSSYIGTIPGTGSQYTGANRAGFMLREDKHLLNFIQSVRPILRK